MPVSVFACTLELDHRYFLCTSLEIREHQCGDLNVSKWCLAVNGKRSIFFYIIDIQFQVHVSMCSFPSLVKQITCRMTKVREKNDCALLVLFFTPTTFRTQLNLARTLLWCIGDSKSPYFRGQDKIFTGRSLTVCLLEFSYFWYFVWLAQIGVGVCAVVGWDISDSKWLPLFPLKLGRSKRTQCLTLWKQKLLGSTGAWDCY